MLTLGTAPDLRLRSSSFRPFPFSLGFEFLFHLKLDFSLLVLFLFLLFLCCVSGEICFVICTLSLEFGIVMLDWSFNSCYVM